MRWSCRSFAEGRTHRESSPCGHKLMKVVVSLPGSRDVIRLLYILPSVGLVLPPQGRSNSDDS
ncbi:expressed unknown protein [Ectocarpus siliculosus]|uniref:Uncharacterized protein n=1 Tax=Ectocarpus siliculosus TaxID=2880 RepID=D8LAV6_ECTSI|nr:expressed unknown protein [Ectocarpus siliculosus]|eukprot:CBN76465.1 expressed unknown protein [Ectocarpus siliculosus]